MKTPELKKVLQTIRENRYDFNGYDPGVLTASMMNAIGTVDGELRDALIYTTFAHLITEDRLNPESLKKLLAESLDESHLFHGLGESGTDSVFARAFSVLVVALILYADRRRSFLSGTEMVHVKESLIDYLKGEQDRRGYVEGKGWAHAIAHTADVFDEMAKHPLLESNGLYELLETIQNKLLWGEGVDTHNEDERLALPVFAIMERRLVKDERIFRWIEDFQHLLVKAKETSTDTQSMNMRLNVRNFLRSLFFRLRFEQRFPSFQEKIEQTLNGIRVF